MNFCRAIKFTFGQIPLGNVWTPLSSQLWVKLYYYYPKRMELTLNNPRRLICHWEKRKGRKRLYQYFRNVLYIYYHHHHITLLARISLTLSSHPSRKVFQATSCIDPELSYIGSSWSSDLCSSMWRDPLGYIALPYFSSSPACLTRLSWIVFGMGDSWLYSCFFVRCCFQELFNTAGTILV